MLSIINLILFLAVTGYAIYLFARIVYSRYTFIKLGQPSDFKRDMKESMREILVNGFGQKKLLKDRKSGIMHIVMFYGFIILQFGALDLIYKGFSNGNHLPLIPGYRYFTFMQEIVTALVLIAVLYAGYRRFIEKLPRLKRGWKASLVIFFIGGLMLSIMFSAASEAVWKGHEAAWTTPVSSVVAAGLGFMSAGAAQVAFYIFWWMHLLILLSFLVYVPQSKHFHILVAPINLFYKRQGPVGKLSTIDFTDESVEEYGKGKIEDFTQKQLIDLYACVECGRCTNMCPASGTGKMLSPMQLIVKMRDHLTEKGAAITSQTAWMPAFAFPNNSALAETAATAEIAEHPKAKVLDQIQLIGDVITEQEIWACTTCRNCEDQCPVMNEHVDKIIDMRRHLVMTQGAMSTEVSRTFNNIERQSNPWGLSRNDRDKWRTLREDVHVPTVKEVDEFEYLFWVGSMGSYDNRSIKISQAFAKLMNEAGVTFAILGNEEKNSGDTARRMGNEFLFQQLAEENIANFQKYNVKKIVTADPHAFHTFKNEYPDFGLEGVEVYHHSELLAKWLEEGRLKPKKEISERITYHDSCYLGRYNDIYDKPRQIMEKIKGIEIVEMDRSKCDSMCCGAGGGMMWMEETEGKRVNVARTEQALEVNPTTIASACPYCLTMIGDGTKAKEVEDTVSTKDIAEILEEAM